MDVLITDKVCYFKRDGAREYGTDRYFLLSNFFSRNDKLYIFRMMGCLDGISLRTETGDEESRIR